MRHHVPHITSPVCSSSKSSSSVISSTRSGGRSVMSTSSPLKSLAHIISTACCSVYKPFLGIIYKTKAKSLADTYRGGAAWKQNTQLLIKISPNKQIINKSIIYIYKGRNHFSNE